MLTKRVMQKINVVRVRVTKIITVDITNDFMTHRHIILMISVMMIQLIHQLNELDDFLNSIVTIVVSLFFFFLLCWVGFFLPVIFFVSHKKFI